MNKEIILIVMLILLVIFLMIIRIIGRLFTKNKKSKLQDGDDIEYDEYGDVVEKSTPRKDEVIDNADNFMTLMDAVTQLKQEQQHIKRELRNQKSAPINTQEIVDEIIPLLPAPKQVDFEAVDQNFLVLEKKIEDYATEQKFDNNDIEDLLTRIIDDGTANIANSVSSLELEFKKLEFKMEDLKTSGKTQVIDYELISAKIRDYTQKEVKDIFDQVSDLKSKYEETQSELKRVIANINISSSVTKETIPVEIGSEISESRLNTILTEFELLKTTNTSQNLITAANVKQMNSAYEKMQVAKKELEKMIKVFYSDGSSKEELNQIRDEQKEMRSSITSISELLNSDISNQNETVIENIYNSLEDQTKAINAVTDKVNVNSNNIKIMRQEQNHRTGTVNTVKNYESDSNDESDKSKPKKKYNLELNVLDKLSEI